jgi:hypothetical protein
VCTGGVTDPDPERLAIMNSGFAERRIWLIPALPGPIERHNPAREFFYIFLRGIFSSTLSKTASSAVPSDSTFCVSQKLSQTRTCLQLGELHKNAFIIRQNIY